VIDSTNDTLIIFTRFPRPGKTKTRLSRVIGAEAAAHCQRQMTEVVVAQARALGQSRDIDLQIHYHDASQAEMAAWLGQDLSYYPQVEGDIGQRMAEAFASGFAGGAEQIILIGSDCPDISTKILATAFNALPQADLVLGPAMDGGYYLIGMHTLRPELFTDITWGSERVMNETLNIAASEKLIVKQVDPLHDIDRPEDLKYFRY
jgi:rSAM/selenodomain-associated transferase 1